MKLLFVTDYFYPYVHGGAEISVFQFAKKMEAVVLTPNYGSLNSEIIDDITVIRFPWPIHFNEFSSQLSPMFYANPIAWLYLAVVIIVNNQKIKADIFHCQSVNSFPGVWLAARLLRKKCVLSVRDNQALCNYGWCLSKNNGKTCNLREYLLEDFRHYYADKIKQKNAWTLFINLIFALTGRFRCRILKYFTNFADERICGSRAQSDILAANGIKANSIYNIFEFPEELVESSPRKELLYATKLSEGKGIDLLLHSWVDIHKNFPGYALKIVGDGNRGFYQRLVKKLKVSESVSFSSMPDFKEVRETRKFALLEIVPSIYPESFGRAALEAIALGVPVVATNRGGLKEIVENEVTGYVVDPEEKQLANAIMKGIENNDQLRRNIKSRYLSLKRRFETEPVEKYLDLYKKLT